MRSAAQSGCRRRMRPTRCAPPLTGSRDAYDAVRAVGSRPSTLTFERSTLEPPDQGGSCSPRRHSLPTWRASTSCVIPVDGSRPRPRQPRCAVVTLAARERVRMSQNTEASGGRTRNLRALGSIMGAALAPPVLVVALAYYFAVKRQEALALHFGIDTSVLGYSTQDYLLRGGDALFLVLLFASLTGLVAIAAHVALTRHAQATWPVGRLRATSIAFEVVGVLLLVVGLVGVFEPLPLNMFVRSLSFGAGIVLLAYGVYFAGRVRGAGFFQPDGR